MIEEINWQPVESSNIAAVAWRKGGPGGMEGTLSVRFIKSGIYHYLDVPEKIFTGLLEAESVGHFFSENVKGKFEYVKDAPRKESS
jgi:hypothetical protein